MPYFFIIYNLHLQVCQKKIESNQALDSIYLLDVDSDDESITEKEDFILNNIMSWMDLGDYFADLTDMGISKLDKDVPSI